MTILLALLQEIAGTFREMAPYLLLGLTFAGILHLVFSKQLIIRHLGGDTISAVIKAAVLGIPLPLCSCGVLPTAVSLRKNRASEGATMGFLISTPQTGVDSIVATYGMLGPVFAIFRPLAALVMGIAGGVVLRLLPGTAASTSPQEVESDDTCQVCTTTSPHSHGWGEKILAMGRYAYGEFLDDISLHLLVGIVISGAISFFLPADFFTRYVGDQWLEMLLMIIGGIPLYVCATASIPIAAALMLKGLSPGAAFVFLAVGPATNAASITLIGNTLGKRFVSVYLAVLSIFAILSGFVLNGVFAVTEYSAAAQLAHHHADTGTLFGLVFTIIFAVLLGLSLFRKAFPRLWRAIASTFGTAQSVPHDTGNLVGIDGMTCNHCARTVSESIQKVPGVESVQVDLGSASARVEGEFDREAVKRAVEEVGYKVRTG